MANLINAKCPNCGANLQLPQNLDRAFCVHCGGSVIIGRDETHYHTHQAQKTAIPCPDCKGRGFFICNVCNGKMSCSASYVNSENVIQYCYYGKCPKCKGGGKESFILTCSFCKGQGVCPYCHGTHRCITCGGRGNITCKLCGGSGFKVYRGD
jgi:DnaJ-class molecular chaperone